MTYNLKSDLSIFENFNPALNFTKKLAAGQQNQAIQGPNQFVSLKYLLRVL